MKLKTTAILLLLLLLTTTAYPTLAKADMGPKPSVEIEFMNLPSGECYATLLSSTQSTGPFSASNESQSEIDEVFNSYTDKDGFYYLHFYRRIDDTSSFIWSYYPPHDFKILVYVKQTNEFITNDEVLSRYAFSSYFSTDLQGGTTTKNYDYASEILKLIARIVLTLAVEIGIALLFGYRKNDLKIIVIANAVTQIALNVWLNAINYRSGSLALALNYFGAEILVFIAEALLYSIVLTVTAKRANAKPRRIFIHIIYALLANIASFGLGAGYLLLIGV